MAPETLATYLNDHLAGSSTGLELAEKLAEETEGTDLGASMVQLAADIAADRLTLQEVVRSLGIEEQESKQALGWVAEKATRLRLNRMAMGSEALARLLDMETLSMGIEGKRNLWHSLSEVAPVYPELTGFDFDNLVKRAEDQHDRLEIGRRAAAGLAFTPS